MVRQALLLNEPRRGELSEPRSGERANTLKFGTNLFVTVHTNRHVSKICGRMATATYLSEKSFSVSLDGFEPSTFSLRGNRSTTELQAQIGYMSKKSLNQTCILANKPRLFTSAGLTTIISRERLSEIVLSLYFKTRGISNLPAAPKTREVK